MNALEVLAENAPAGSTADLSFGDIGFSALAGSLKKGNDGKWYYGTGKVVTDPAIIAKAEWGVKNKQFPKDSPKELPKDKIDKTSDQSATSKAFRDKVTKISGLLGVSPSDLYRIMHFETAGQMKANTPSPGGKCIGLIQFCPIAQQALNVSKEELAAMTEVEQLDYVYKYFKYWNLPRDSDIGDLYMAVLLPVGLNKPDDFVLGSKGDKSTLNPSYLTKGAVWAENPAFRVPGRTYFTVADVKQKIRTMKFY